MIVAVGSKNPAKSNAVTAVCARVFAGCEVIAHDVPSGVRAQPIGADETRAGAMQRARGALAAVPGALFGVGLEGGVDALGHLINCVAVAHADGRENLAWGVRFPLPPAIVRRVLAGEELGPVMDEITGLRDSKTHSGAVGILTNGVFTRGDMWQGPVACALAPFLHPELYR